MTDLNGHPFPGPPRDRTDLDAVRALLGSPEPSLNTVVDGRARLLAALAKDVDDTVEGGPLVEAGPFADTSPFAGAEDSAPGATGEDRVGLETVRAPAVRRTGRTRTAGRVRRRLATAGAGLAAAATILVAAVLAAPGGPVTSMGPGTPAATAKGTPSASSTSATGAKKARDVLLAAADTIAKEPAGAGAYWRTKTLTRWQTPTGDGSYVLELSQSGETWLARRPGDKSWKISRQLSAKPATASDEAAWRKAGSPSSWNLWPSEVPEENMVRAKPGEPVVSELRGRWKGAGGVLGTGLVSWEDLAALPGDVDGLRTHLTKLVTKAGAKKAAHGPEQVQPQLRQAVMQIAIALPVTPQVRATAYRLLATLPGVRAENEVTDQLGRRGQAIVYRSDSRVKEWIVVDPRTGRILARESTSLYTTRGGGETPLHHQNSFEQMGWTDERPPTRG
ncbi:CU044_5270 family protein, partial [Nonomuraea sp. RK-328]|nr:CU044_5270 family protein [Nonomuraea sp. RK-328]